MLPTAARRRCYPPASQRTALWMPQRSFRRPIAASGPHPAGLPFNATSACISRCETEPDDERQQRLQPVVVPQFEQLAYLAGLPPIRLHDLRHFAATLHLAAGVDVKIVQDMLGHSSRAITSDTYESVLPESGPRRRRNRRRADPDYQDHRIRAKHRANITPETNQGTLE